MMTIETNTVIEQFKSAMMASGIEPPDGVTDDGDIHRFKTTKGSHKKNGWYCLHSDGVPAGVFGDWSEGATHHWCAKADKAMTPEEIRANRERVAAAKAKRDKLQQEEQARVASEATMRYAAAKACTTHPYTDRKSVAVPDGVRLEGETLLVPLRDSAGTLWSLQTIAPNGEKRFMTGGRKAGCYFSIGKPTDDGIAIEEGLATGASVHQARGGAVAIAFDAGNLMAVAQALRTKYPAMKLALGADDDWQRNDNPGLTKAREAAMAVNGYLAAPEFGGYVRGFDDTDFNDLHKLAGLEAVKACFDRAVLAADGEWPDPQDLIAKFDALPYPLDALPPLIRGAVLEVCGFVKAPPALITQSALTALSVAIQAHHDVQRAVNLESPSSLFMLAIAESGERKTTCDGYFSKSILNYEARQKEQAKPLIEAYQTELEIWEMERAGIKEKIKSLARDGKPNNDQKANLKNLDSEKPQAPRVPKLIYEDATPEGLAMKLVSEWPSGGVFSSEAGVVFGGHAMNKDVAMRNMGRLNKLWDGKIPETTRATTAGYSATDARFTMSLQVQESAVRAFFDNSKGLARGTGFMARFLVSWPESTIGSREFIEPPDDWPALAAFNNRLTVILDKEAPVDTDGKLTPAMLTLSPAAKSLWVEFYNQIERELRSNGEFTDVKDVASKTADNATRLAALFHVFEGHIGAIDETIMESAATIAFWHLLEARRFLGEMALPEELANPARLETWLKETCRRDGVTRIRKSDAMQRGPIRTKDSLNDAVKELVSLDRLRQIKDGKTTMLILSPKI